MGISNNKKQLSIWSLAFGYFAFYVPYSGTTKILSKGLLTESGEEISGYEMLPMVLLGTVFGFLCLLIFTGWWKQAGKVKVFGLKIPFASNKYTLFSGIATAVIIATTTLAYSFTGISIVFAALLMRGGVLIMAPFIDIVYGRKIQWYSWLAFGLTLFSLLIVFSEEAGYNIVIAAGINIIAYLSGYFLRLQFMTHTAKSGDAEANKKYFVEEMLSAMAAILIIPIVLAFIGQGVFMEGIRAGYSSVLSSSYLFPALLIGVLYACLYIFGSRIYLNHRENTFCIPINRCASLLAGVTTAIILSFMFDGIFYSTTQLIGAMVLVMAICVLSIPIIIEAAANLRIAKQRTYIFVCPGNMGRSPMAQAICMDKLIKSALSKRQHKKIKIMSAGISAQEGLVMEAHALSALEHLEIQTFDHSSKLLSLNEVTIADKIWCITPEHKTMVLEKFPQVEEKLFCLDEEGVLPSPHGKDLDVYIEFAQKLDDIIDGLIDNKAIAFS